MGKRMCGVATFNRVLGKPVKHKLTKYELQYYSAELALLTALVCFDESFWCEMNSTKELVNRGYVYL